MSGRGEAAALWYRGNTELVSSVLGLACFPLAYWVAPAAVELVTWSALDSVPRLLTNVVAAVAVSLCIAMPVAAGIHFLVRRYPEQP